MANPDLNDPTNARLRDFDIPVTMPRIDFIEPDDFAGAVFTGDLSDVRPQSHWAPVPGPHGGPR